MKTCFKCGVEKPLTEFYTHPKMADGHLNKCKSCARADVASRIERMSSDPHWAISERARHRIKSRQYRADGRAKTPTTEENRTRCEEYSEKHPDKSRAHAIVHRALRSGKLTRQPCEKCGALPAQAHHDDYSRPLDVRWLCVPHHTEHHANERDAALLNQAV